MISTRALSLLLHAHFNLTRRNNEMMYWTCWTLSKYIPQQKKNKINDEVEEKEEVVKKKKEEEEEEEKKKKKQGKQTTLHVLPALSFPAAFNGIVARLRAPPGLPYLTAEWHS